MVKGQLYELNTDFRACLSTILAGEDQDLTEGEKQRILLENLYLKVPDDRQAALEQAAWFLRGNLDGADEQGPRVYSFVKDASLIFSAFKQTHNVDLITAKMHWWVFLALFMDIGSDTAFSTLVGLRQRVKTGTASKEERRIARDMGSLFEVPELVTPEERSLDDEFMQQLAIGNANRAKAKK
jgi:hypothetical protein